MARPPHQRDPDSTVAVEQAVDVVGETLAATGDEIAKGDSLADSFRRGAKLESFMVLEELGRGGMGVVVSAYDPQLDRKVAIKVLKPGVFGAEASGPARARLLREAQAMAKLSHPHVITVYEVGQHADQIFVVMEFVDGQTLKGWWREQPRTCRQILDAFVQAGEGLAAAHRAGLVHRDFKPDNVLVDRAGHVRVTDFGLAGSAAAAVAAAAPGDLPTSTPFAITLTHDGQLLGTPAYMAPEQHERKHVDAKADQFAYCVALHEALYGQRPFVETGGLAALSDAVRGNERRELPRDHGVPTWVHKILERGLSIDPADRYPSMDALLDDLRRDPAARRRRVAAFTGALLLVAGTAAGIAYTATDRPALCTNARARLAGIWDAGVKASVRKAFEATSIPHAPATYARVESVLDAYAADWIAMRTEACEATHVRGDQSAALLDLRMECLDRRAGELAALTRLFATEASDELLGDAAQAAYDLAAVSACADRDALTARVPLPADPKLRARILDAQRKVDEVSARYTAGRYSEGLELGTKLESEVRGVDYPPVRAEVFYLLGVLNIRLGNAKAAEQWLEMAAQSASQGRDDALLARVWSQLLYAVGYQQGRFAEADVYARAGDAAAVRANDSGAVRAELSNNRCVVLRVKGDYPGAKEACERAIALYADEYREPHPSVATAYINLAIALGDLAQYDDSEHAYEKALSILRATVGDSHPEVARALQGYADSYERRGDPDKALKVQRESLEIRERTLGPNHPHVAAALSVVGISLKNRGDLEEAAALFERAIRIWEASDASPHLASAYNNLANVRRRQGRLGEAEELLEKALQLKRDSFGDDHPSVAITLTNLARVHADQGDYGKAQAEYERALEIRRVKLGQEHPKVAETLWRLGDLALQQRRWEEARRYCTEALSIRAKEAVSEANDDRQCIARAELGLGNRSRAIVLAEAILETVTEARVPVNQRATWLFRAARVFEGARAHRRAVEVGRLAHDEAKLLGDDGAQELAEIESWLARLN